MLYAQKGNRVIDIDEASRQRYVNMGYTIFEDGKVVEHGKGATVSLAEYQKLLDENAKLKAEIKELKAEIKELKTEVVLTEDLDAPEKVEEETAEVEEKQKSKSKK